MKLSPIAGMQSIGWATETFVGKSGEASATISKGHIVECTLTKLEEDANQEVKLATGDGFGIYAVALESVAAGEEGLFALSGKVEVIGGASVSAGVRIMPEAAGEAIAHVGTGNNNVCCGIAVDALTDGNLGTVLFDGFQIITAQDQTPD
tara:strand:+ start:5889 stop:6338 length:450 start_codon:yes stop_codon:yes gene_type:complete